MDIKNHIDEVSLSLALLLMRCHSHLNEALQKLKEIKNTHTLLGKQKIHNLTSKIIFNPNLIRRSRDKLEHVYEEINFSHMMDGINRCISYHGLSTKKVFSVLIDCI